jgi:hypothetical protein
VLVATVVAVFGDGDGRPAAEPAAVGQRLLAYEQVVTVRINAHGTPSAFRADVVAPTHHLGVQEASDLARAVAADLGLTVEVASVGLVRDGDRVELFRVGERGGELVWGDR